MGGDCFTHFVNPRLFPASSTNVLVRSLLWSTPCLWCTPTSQAVRTVHHPDITSQPDPCPILIQRHQWSSDDQRSSSYSATNGPLATNDHKWPISDPRIPSFPSTSSIPAQNRFLCWPHYVGTSSSPVTLVNGQTLQTLIKSSAVSHHLRGLSQGWSTCRDNLFLFFSFLPRLTKVVSCFHHSLKQLRLSLHGGLHPCPIVFTSKLMGGPLSSKISIIYFLWIHFSITCF